MRVVITGSSNGIGLATAQRFLNDLTEEFEVFGIDVVGSKIESENYHHHKVDVRDSFMLPPITDVDILVNCAGVQNSSDDIGVNLKGTINATQRYGLQPEIKAIVNMASVSAHNGAEFGEYVASKGGVLSYTIWTAKQVANYGATCNSISFGGVLTNLNSNVIEDSDSWSKIMSMTPLNKWCTAEEAAEWIYFVAVKNKSMTGQDIIIDNGEFFNHTFVWKE